MWWQDVMTCPFSRRISSWGVRAWAGLDDPKDLVHPGDSLWWSLPKSPIRRLSWFRGNHRHQKAEPFSTALLEKVLVVWLLLWCGWFDLQGVSSDLLLLPQTLNRWQRCGPHRVIVPNLACSILQRNSPCSYEWKTCATASARMKQHCVICSKYLQNPKHTMSPLIPMGGRIFSPLVFYMWTCPDQNPEAGFIKLTIKDVLKEEYVMLSHRLKYYFWIGLTNLFSFEFQFQWYLGTSLFENRSLTFI